MTVRYAMKRFLLAIPFSLLALALTGCPDDTPTDPDPDPDPTGSDTTRWEMTWTYVDTATCADEPISAMVHQALVMQGIDTFAMVTEGDLVYSLGGTGQFNSIDVVGLGKCPDPPDQSWSEPEITQPPSVTNPSMDISAIVEPLGTPQVPFPTPTHVRVYTGSLYQYGLARHKTPMSDYTNILLGQGAFQFNARFPWPLQNNARFDTTALIGESLGRKLIMRVEASLRKID